MNLERKKFSPSEQKEDFKKTKEIIFVPGLSEEIGMYADVARILSESGQNATFLSTHPEEESETQHKISSALTKEDFKAGRGLGENAKIMSVKDRQYFESQKSNDPEIVERHSNLEHRVSLAEDALREAMEGKNESDEITIVGHSAGGFATLAALARVITSSDTKLPNIHAVLIAPAIPGEVKWLAVEPTFVGVVMRDFVRKLKAINSSYLWKLISNQDINATEEDLAEILGPMNDKEYLDKVTKRALPIAGGEGLDLIKFTKALNGTDLEFIDWPENVKIDVVIPTNDKWVNVKAQEMLVSKVLKGLAGENVKKHLLDDMPHLPLGKKDAADKVVEIIFGKSN